MAPKLISNKVSGPSKYCCVAITEGKSHMGFESHWLVHIFLVLLVVVFFLKNLCFLLG